jgi:predicted nuclease of predicted toxin-antitoxin system
MKFLVDVNASGSLSQWLREQGHDVVQVSNRDSRMSDEDILSWAVEEQRIIVTTDSDFEEMIWRQAKSHRGVLRLESLPRDERKSLLKDALDRHRNDLVNGAIVIADSKKYRVRNP